MINYIELNKGRVSPNCTIKGIYAPDMTKWELDISEQNAIEEIHLGAMGNGIYDSKRIAEKMNFTYTDKLEKVVIYLNTAKACDDTLEWLNYIGTDTTSKFCFDEFGRLVDLEASLEVNKIILRGE